MNTALIVVAVFAVLLAPFLLFLAALRFIPAEKRLRMVGVKPLQGVRRLSPRMAAILEGLAGLF